MCCIEHITLRVCRIMSVHVSAYIFFSLGVYITVKLCAQEYVPKKLVTAHQVLGEDYHLAVLNCSQTLPRCKVTAQRTSLARTSLVYVP